MLQQATQFASRTSNEAARRRVFYTVFGSLTAAAGYGCYFQMQRHAQSTQRWSKINENLSSFKPYNVRGQEALYYPWYTGRLIDWEYKLVKLRGYFREERFFVRRERDGQVGYLVLAPFITGIVDNDNSRQGQNPPNEHAVIINLGWVPKDNLDDIQMSSEPIPLLVSH